MSQYEYGHIRDHDHVNDRDCHDRGSDCAGGRENGRVRDHASGHENDYVQLLLGELVLLGSA